MKSAILAGCAALTLSTCLHAGTNFGQIMPLGDSETEGQFFPSGTVGVGPVTDYPGGYRNEFYQDLMLAGDSFQFVGSSTIAPSPLLIAAGETHHEGHPGFTSTNLYSASADIYDNLPTYFSGADSSPNIVLLMIGTYDTILSQQGYTLDPSLVTADPLRIFQLDPTAHLFWSLIPPSPSNTGVESAIVSYNSWITSDAATLKNEGYNVTLIDNFSPFLNSDGSVDQAMFADNVHPNQFGYNVIGDTDAAAVLSSVPEPGTLMIFAGGCLLVRRRNRTRSPARLQI